MWPFLDFGIGADWDVVALVVKNEQRQNALFLNLLADADIQWCKRRVERVDAAKVLVGVDDGLEPEFGNLLIGQNGEFAVPGTSSSAHPCTLARDQRHFTIVDVGEISPILECGRVVQLSRPRARSVVLFERLDVRQVVGSCLAAAAEAEYGGQCQNNRAKCGDKTLFHC